MSFNKGQCKILNLYRYWHESGGPSVLRMLGWRLPVYAILIASFMACIYLGASKELIAGAIGFVIGAALAQVGMLRRSVVLWPTIEQITDWQKVNQLLEKGT